MECLKILKEELVPALGCTEPIAIAYAAAKAAAVLGQRPDNLEVWCSGNIIKNVKSVVVPNTGGLKGVKAAAVAGAIGGNAELGLEVLSALTPIRQEEIRQLAESSYCVCRLLENAENLHLIVKAKKGWETAEVEIKTQHTNITRISKNGKLLMEKNEEAFLDHAAASDPALSVRSILEFADTVRIADVRDLLERQIQMNSAIAAEGMAHPYGADVGKTLLKFYGDSVLVRAAASAAAGSDARMSGCNMPVVINSGSGNQGMAVSLPVIQFAQELGVSREKLYRALCVSNLTAVYLKRDIGRLSAYCGAVCAACGSAAGITYLHGGGYEDVACTITNHLANISGVVCDGAKPSCAAKVASAVSAGIMAHYLSAEHKHFAAGEGLVKENVEQTIQSVGRMGRDGMKETDVEILRIMLDN